MNLVGSSEIFFDLTGSIHRSGSNTSASSPQSAVLRCIKKGNTRIGVSGGMYSGRLLELDVNVGSALGNTTPCDRLARIFDGSGVNKRIDSLITARTECYQRNIHGLELKENTRTIFQLFERFCCRHNVVTNLFKNFLSYFL